MRTLGQHSIECRNRMAACLALAAVLSLQAAASGQEGMVAGWGDGIAGMYQVPSGENFVALTGGDEHNLALRSDGAIFAWGMNTHGQLNVPDGENDYFVAIAARRNYSLALRWDGSIAAWGDDGGGQVSTVPTEDGFVSLAAGFEHAVALRDDGSIVAWGDNTYGQLDGISEWNPENPFVAIAAGGYHNLALRADGTIAAWGDDLFGETAVPLGNDYIAVAAGGWHSLALRSDGTIVAWGFNPDGRADAPAGSFVAIAGGTYGSIALRKDGSIVEWPEAVDTPLATSFVAVHSSARSMAIAAGNPFDDTRPLDSTGRWVPVTEGLLDTTTNLVWGFGANEVNSYLRGHGTNMTSEWAQPMPVLTPEGVSTYPEFSNWFFNRQDADWRLPTIEEMKAAHQGRLIDYLDASPRPGFQRLGSVGDYSESGAVKCWAASKSSMGWWLNFDTGESGKLTGYLVNFIPVRPHAPPPKGSGKPR